MRKITYAAGALVLVGALSGCGASTGAGAGTGAATSTATAQPMSAASTSTTPATTSASPVPTSPATTPSTSSAPATTKSTGERGTAFTAYGQNVAWRAVVENGTLTTEGPVAGERTVKVERSAWAKGVEFTGRDGRTEVSLTIRTGSCADPAGDTGMVATLSVGDRQLKGCAVEGAVPLPAL